MSLCLIDTSVWARLKQPAVANLIAQAIEAGAAVIIAPLVLELLRSAWSAKELAELSLDSHRASGRALVITFALREYLAASPMTPHTFTTRVFGTRGRREVRPDDERIFFYENPRDPDINAALTDACRRLNLRRLSRGGRRLRYEMARSDGGQFN